MSYTLPTLAGLRAVEPNGLRVASTFAGGGGSSTGYRLAGFTVLWASEFVESARETYRANARSGTIVDGRDIRQVTADGLLDAIGLDVGELDLLDGSPPCSPFSTSGKRSAGWGKSSRYSETAQRSDDLFFEFARLVEGVRPKVFVAENVSGLVRGSAIGYFKRILARLKSAGYRVSARLLDASWLGVPQVRRRLIFVGVRDDLGVDPTHPRPDGEQIPLSEALRLAEEIDGPVGDVDPETGEDIKIGRYAIGREASRLRPGESSDRYFNLVRPRLDLPCPTVTATAAQVAAASVIHPGGARKLSLREARAVCGFPIDYDLRGTYEQRFERLGRSVPPLMMKRVAETVRDEIFGGGR